MTQGHLLPFPALNKAPPDRRPAMLSTLGTWIVYGLILALLIILVLQLTE